MITGATAGNKVYDGTTAAAVSGGSLAGLMSGDSVTLGGTPSGSFASKTVSNNKPLTASGYAISGLDSGNYTLLQPTGLTANIAAAGLTPLRFTHWQVRYDPGHVERTLHAAVLVAGNRND